MRHLSCSERPWASTETELLARLAWRAGPGAHLSDYPDRFLNELAIGGENTTLKVEIILKTDPGMAAKQHSLSHHRHLHPADAEAGPDGAGRVRVAAVVTDDDLEVVRRRADSLGG